MEIAMKHAADFGDVAFGDPVQRRHQIKDCIIGDWDSQSRLSSGLGHFAGGDRSLE
jgi:hypothetical protein